MLFSYFGLNFFFFTLYYYNNFQIMFFYWNYLHRKNVIYNNPFSWSSIKMPGNEFSKKKKMRTRNKRMRTIECSGKKLLEAWYKTMEKDLIHRNLIKITYSRYMNLLLTALWSDRYNVCRKIYWLHRYLIAFELLLFNIFAY